MKNEAMSNSVEGRVYQGLQSLIKLRMEKEAFAGSELEILPTENEHVIAFIRTYDGQRAVIFANFSESSANHPAPCIRAKFHSNKETSSRDERNFTANEINY